MKKPVTLSGRNGFDPVEIGREHIAVAADDRACRSGPCVDRGPVLDQQGHAHFVEGNWAPRPVLVVFSARPPGARITARETSRSPRLEVDVGPPEPA